DVNDHPEQAEMLAKRVRGIRCKFNLIAYNEHPESDFRTPSNERIAAFQKILLRHNLTAVVRKSNGRDIMAACGQLKGAFHI
ncbi:MAG: 23S rRNA (adenine(2503)-C(2))-methyltransferase RlmN, partial [Syntrophales bacterium]|nr:23S rRNA (adenine(2503)-C(2))-methyltransferase RlmN [Syntrophales bacterium]